MAATNQLALLERPALEGAEAEGLEEAEEVLLAVEEPEAAETEELLDAEAEAEAEADEAELAELAELTPLAEAAEEVDTSEALEAETEAEPVEEGAAADPELLGSWPTQEESVPGKMETGESKFLAPVLSTIWRVTLVPAARLTFQDKGLLVASVAMVVKG